MTNQRYAKITLIGIGYICIAILSIFMGLRLSYGIGFLLFPLFVLLFFVNLFVGWKLLSLKPISKSIPSLLSLVYTIVALINLGIISQYGFSWKVLINPSELRRLYGLNYLDLFVPIVLLIVSIFILYVIYFSKERQFFTTK